MSRSALERLFVAIICALCGITIGLAVILIGQHSHQAWANQRAAEELILMSIVYVSGSAPYARRRLLGRVGSGKLRSPLFAMTAFIVGPLVAPGEIWRDIRGAVK